MLPVTQPNLVHVYTEERAAIVSVFSWFNFLSAALIKGMYSATTNVVCSRVRIHISRYDYRGAAAVVGVGVAAAQAKAKAKAKPRQSGLALGLGLGLACAGCVGGWLSNV